MLFRSVKGLGLDALSTSLAISEPLNKLNSLAAKLNHGSNAVTLFNTVRLGKLPRRFCEDLRTKYSISALDKMLDTIEHLAHQLAAALPLHPTEAIAESEHTQLNRMLDTIILHPEHWWKRIGEANVPSGGVRTSRRGDTHSWEACRTWADPLGPVCTHKTAQARSATPSTSNGGCCAANARWDTEIEALMVSKLLGKENYNNRAHTSRFGPLIRLEPEPIIQHATRRDQECESQSHVNSVQGFERDCVDGQTTSRRSPMQSADRRLKALVRGYIQRLGYSLVLPGVLRGLQVLKVLRLEGMVQDVHIPVLVDELAACRCGNQCFFFSRNIS